MLFRVEKTPEPPTNSSGDSLQRPHWPPDTPRRSCNHALKRRTHMSHLTLRAPLSPHSKLPSSSERIHICTSLFEVVSPGAQDSGEVFLRVDRVAGEVGGALSFRCHDSLYVATWGGTSPRCVQREGAAHDESEGVDLIP